MTLRAARAGPRDRTGRRSVAFEPGNANCRYARFAHAPRPHTMGVCNAMAYNLTVPKQAENTLREHETIVLRRAHARAFFFNAIANPPAPNDKLTAALNEHTRRIDSR